MEKNQTADGVIITKQVEEVVKIEDLNLEIERLEAQVYEANVRMVEAANAKTEFEAKLAEKRKLKDDIFLAFPDLMPVVVSDVVAKEII